MIVYDVKTGEPFECKPVDARELIASKAYRAEAEKPKKARKPKPEKVAEEAE